MTPAALPDMGHRMGHLQAAVGRQLFGRQPQPPRHVHQDLRAQGDVGHLLHQRLEFGLHAGTPFGRGDVCPLGQLLQQEGRQGQGIAHAGLEGLQSFGPHEAVGVVLGRQEEEIELFGIGQQRQRILQRPPRGATPCGIAIEGKHDPIGQAQQLAQVHGGGGGTQRGHGIVAAVLVQHHHIHVALHHQHTTTGADALTRLEEAVEFMPLGKQRPLGRVEVLGFSLSQHPPTKADDLAARIPDGKHDALTKAVVALAVFTGNHQSGSHGVLGGVVGEHAFQVAPARWRIAQPEMACDLAGDTPFLQVGNGSRCFLQA